jgi:hypothetical protein
MPESPEDRIKRLMRESVAASPKVIDLAAAAKRRGKPPQQTKANHRMRITGNNNTAVAGDGNQVTVNLLGAPRPRITVQPGPDAVTQAQAAEIRELVAKVADVSGRPFGFIWSTLKHKYRFTRYELLPATQFPEVQAYLRKWIARFTNATPMQGDEQRKKLLRRLHAQARKMPGAIEQIKAFAMGRFGTESLAELSIGQLEGVIREFRL